MSEEFPIFKKQSVWDAPRLFSNNTQQPKQAFPQDTSKTIWKSENNHLKSQTSQVSTKQGLSSGMPAAIHLSTPLRSNPNQLRTQEPFRLLHDESTYDMTIHDSILSDTSESAESIIASLKLQVETLITAIMMNDTASANAIAGADSLEISHRIMTRMQLLKEENVMLAQLANGNHAASLEATNAQLRQENENLKNQLAELRTQRQTVGKSLDY